MSSDSKTATAAPDRHPLSLVPTRNLVLAGLLLATACGAPAPKVRSAPHPEPTPVPQETPQAQPPPPVPPIPATPAETPAPTPSSALEPPRTDQVIVLDPGGESEGSTRSLVEAARAERERRAHAAPSAIVINDKNLKQHATGQLTVATPGKKEAVSESDAAQPVRDEQYWRSRALEIRLRWRHAADDAKELETSANGWRRSFYAEKDPNVRNTRIKPEWDRALDRLEQARTDVETAKEDLADLMEEGRAAGALPGWLREGIDQEPQEEPESSNTHKVIEPPVVPPVPPVDPNKDNDHGRGA